MVQPCQSRCGEPAAFGLGSGARPRDSRTLFGTGFPGPDMNSDFIRWLLHVKSIPKGSGSLRLAWEHPWPDWVWALLFIGAGLFAVWSYSRLTGRRAGRGMLAAARLGLLLLLLV